MDKLHHAASLSAWKKAPLPKKAAVLAFLRYVNYNEADIDLDDPYIGVYNFDMNNIQSIEPNEEGQTVIYHKYGSPITFAVDTMVFLKLLYDSKVLNFYFEKEVNKIAPNLINQVKLTNTPRE